MDAQTIWEETLEQGKYLGRVTRISERMGRLVVIKKENGAILLDKQVAHSYSDTFGPDYDEIMDWQDMCYFAIRSQG